MPASSPRAGGRARPVGVDAAGAEMPPSRSLGSQLVAGIDVVLVVVAAVVAIAAGAPALGALIGAGIVAFVDRRWADSMRTPRQQVTVSLFERFGRIWLLAGGIIAAGLIGGRRDGLTAALFVFVAYTVVFVIKLFSGPPEARSVV
jgi:hypothetical protein